MGTVLTIALVAVMVAAIAYGFVLIRVIARKLKIDVDREARVEIDRIVVEAIDYAEEFSRKQKKFERAVVDGVTKLKIATDRIKALVPSLHPKEVEAKVLAAIGDGRKWAGDKITEAGETVSGS